jgi:hypothetical protein
MGEWWWGRLVAAFGNIIMRLTPTPFESNAHSFSSLLPHDAKEDNQNQNGCDSRQHFPNEHV